ncbi:aminopeptidase [Halolamina salifodinae]|uniref:Aminopeptidase n=1 Tax=Halolamina salifodinae TaxID=1202767 RepID=A0A8T4H0C2_9EURY|nr:aminopeptidase [Halolamina salifodinae]MBP1988012.1 aminopeptidase [Halolamina salifodinae]
MDPRIREHAETIVEHSTGIEAGDDVIVYLPGDAEDLAVALHELLGEKGANPLLLTYSERVERAYLRNSDEFDTPEHELALYENADATIIARSGPNPSEKADVDPETTAAYNRAHDPVKKARLDTTWCLTQYPSSGYAQLAGMSTEAYEEFVYDAVTLDWAAQREFQENLVEILDDASEVRIRAGEETDVTMSIEGNTAANDYGEANLPGGEVFTAPVKHSVEGEVHFDMPLYRQGREVQGVRLTFEDGKVTEFSAERNEDVLQGVFDTDEEARYLGELGIGMNDAIDQFTYNMLFDEKMGETVHMAVGSAYPMCVGEGNEVNDSAEHVDMILDMSEDSVIEVDGEVVQEDGEFIFE